LASARDATSPEGPALTTVSGRLVAALPCPAAGIDEQIRDRSGTISAMRNMINPLRPVVCVSREYRRGAGACARERRAEASYVGAGFQEPCLKDWTPHRPERSSRTQLGGRRALVTRLRRVRNYA